MYFPRMNASLTAFLLELPAEMRCATVCCVPIIQESSTPHTKLSCHARRWHARRWRACPCCKPGCALGPIPGCARMHSLLGSKPHLCEGHGCCARPVCAPLTACMRPAVAACACMRHLPLAPRAAPAPCKTLQPKCSSQGTLCSHCLHLCAAPLRGAAGQHAGRSMRKGMQRPGSGAFS